MSAFKNKCRSLLVEICLWLPTTGCLSIMTGIVNLKTNIINCHNFIDSDGWFCSNLIFSFGRSKLVIAMALLVQYMLSLSICHLSVSLYGTSWCSVKMVKQLKIVNYPESALTWYHLLQLMLLLLAEVATEEFIQVVPIWHFIVGYLLRMQAIATWNSPSIICTI